MQKQINSQDSWWHERPTKAADLDTGYRSLYAARKKRDAVWRKAALIVALMFALILSLFSMVGHG